MVLVQPMRKNDKSEIDNIFMEDSDHGFA